jgi:hypothetical protein
MLQLETAVQIAGHSLVALQSSAQSSSFFSNAGIWWYQTQDHLNCMVKPMNRGIFSSALNELQAA